jgi:hypothetical protein
MSDIEHLQWIHDRIINVYGENENVDFLIRFKTIINKFLNQNKMSEEVYRPRELKVVDIPDGGFKIVDVDSNDYQLATILEFNPLNSDLPISMTKEFAEYLISYYNHNYS